MTTLDTLNTPLNEIKGYVVLTSILTIMAMFSFYMLSKYSNLFED
jgi:hypothetical protein